MIWICGVRRLSSQNTSRPEIRPETTPMSRSHIFEGLRTLHLDGVNGGGVRILCTTSHPSNFTGHISAPRMIGAEVTHSAGYPDQHPHAAFCSAQRNGQSGERAIGLITRPH